MQGNPRELAGGFSVPGRSAHESLDVFGLVEE